MSRFDNLVLGMREAKLGPCLAAFVPVEVEFPAVSQYRPLAAASGVSQPNATAVSALATDSRIPCLVVAAVKFANLFAHGVASYY